MSIIHIIISIKRICYLFLISLLPLAANADDSGKCGKKVYYSYDSATRMLTISGEGGMNDFFENEKAPWESYKNEILSINIESGVTLIGEYVFMGCTSLASVSIPNSVTYIGWHAFEGCSGLTSVHITDLEAWCNIHFFDNPLYYSHHLFLNGVEIKDLIIPSCVTTISSQAFFGCSSLTSVTIPIGVTSIGFGTFEGCSSLSSIIVVDGNPIYDSRENCNAIIETASNRLITGCNNSIIPYGVSSIINGAFYECAGLKSITIPNSVTSISSRAFSSCSGLTSIAIPNSVTSIGSRAFYLCSSLTTVTIPNSVTNIDNFAFNGCSALTSVISDIDNPFEIDNSVFEGIPSYAQLIVPKGTKEKYQTTKGWNYFSKILEVGEIGQIFEVDGIYYIIHDKNTVSVYSGSNKLSRDIVIPSQVTYNGKTYIVTSIEEVAFHNSYITSIAIPSTISSIGEAAFRDCSGLTAVHITDVAAWCAINFKFDRGTNPLYYAHHLFLNGKEIKDLVIPSGVTSINTLAFEGCSEIKSVTIPNSVTSIGGAFSSCSSLASVISEITKPFVIGDYAFSVNNDFYETAILTVPAGTIELYQSTAGWNKFQNIIEATSGGADLSINGINYQISSESDHTMMVSKGDYGRVLEVPATISYENNTWSVIGLTDGALDDNGDLAAIIWNPSIAFNARVSNPNLLLYVNDRAYKSSDIKNVVVNGVAESIELTDASGGNDFYCPKAFTARNISYTHDYKMETGIGESRGWETIVLPFDVQKYTHATKGEIETFTTWTMNSNKKPFWLFELTAEGYKDVASIKANTPYIISMPNNKQYEQQYQIPGIVTFSASNVEIKKSDDLKSVSYQGKTFVPNYSNKAGDDLLALNVNSYYVTNSSTDKDGSKFIRGLRAVHPFEAYMTTTDGTRSIDVLDGMTTAVKDLRMTPELSNVMKVYDTKGILVKTVKTNDDLRRGLAAGVYIINGKKMIIK